MLAVSYRTKKELKAQIGKPLRFIETSMFGPEYRENGVLTVVGPSPYQRKYYAQVFMKDGLITKVK